MGSYFVGETEQLQIRMVSVPKMLPWAWCYEREVAVSCVRFSRPLDLPGDCVLEINDSVLCPR